MPSKTIIFERGALYDEVWSNPVSKVAKKYGISDVGLKKICKKLHIPTPSLGYWARLQHGKKPPRIELPRSIGPTVYHHTKHIPYVDIEIAARLASAKAHLPSPVAVKALDVRTDIQECHNLVRRLGKELKGTHRDSRDWPIAWGDGSIAIAASSESHKRALLVADLALRNCLDAGGQLTKGSKDKNCVEVYEELFQLRITEKSLRRERSPTAKERDDAQRYPSLYGERVYYTSEPTGMLTLEVFNAGRSYPSSLCVMARPKKSKTPCLILQRGYESWHCGLLSQEKWRTNATESGN